MKFLLPILTIIFLTGCAQYDKVLKTETGIHVPKINYDKIHVDPDIKEYISINIIEPDGNIIGADDVKDKNDQKRQAVYFSVDTTKLMGETSLDKIKRDKIIEVLVMISDLNSEAYLSRSFAAQLYIDGTIGLTQRTATALQTGITTASPETSAALGLTNLLVGGIGEELNSAVYAENTFEAIQESIRAERAKQKLIIQNKMAKSYNDYTIQDALSDIRYLAEVSSIRIGVGKLLQDAKLKKDKAVEELNK